jgi:hypothetical protein
MSEKTYTNQEIADLLGLEINQFLALIKEMGLIDEYARPTDFALKNGLVKETKIPTQVDDSPFSK